MGTDLALILGFTEVRETEIYASSSPDLIWAGTDFRADCPNCMHGDPDKWGDLMDVFYASGYTEEPSYVCQCGAATPFMSLLYQGGTIRPFGIKLKDAKRVLNSEEVSPNVFKRQVELGIDESQPFWKELQDLLGTELAWTVGKL